MGGECLAGNQCFGVVACQWRDSDASESQMGLLKSSCSCLCFLIGLIIFISIKNKSTLLRLGSSKHESAWRSFGDSALTVTRTQA